MQSLREEALRKEAQRRQDQVRRKMSSLGIEALVTGASAQMNYRGMLRCLANYQLPVFEEYLVILASGPVALFVHDQSGADFAEKYGAVDDVRVIPGHEYNSDPGKCVSDLVTSAKPKGIGIAGFGGLSSNFSMSFKRHVGETRLVDFTEPLREIRMVKTPLEIQLNEAAVKFNEDVFHFYLNLVKPGNEELNAIHAASDFALKNGGEDLYWMASSGEIPRLGFLAAARLQKHLWKAGEYHYIVLEHSAEGGCFGETTHLISLGTPKPEYVRAFTAVSDAQKAAAAQIKPGATVGDLAAAAAAALAGSGCAKPMSGGGRLGAIGHGQGFDIWEYPSVIHGDETPIVPGMRFNIHPSVPLPDGAVITSCDCYISTDTGSRRLSALPYEIIAV